MLCALEWICKCITNEHPYQLVDGPCKFLFSRVLWILVQRKGNAPVGPGEGSARIYMVKAEYWMVHFPCLLSRSRWNRQHLTNVGLTFLLVVILAQSSSLVYFIIRTAVPTLPPLLASYSSGSAPIDYSAARLYANEHTVDIFFILQDRVPSMVYSTLCRRFNREQGLALITSDGASGSVVDRTTLVKT